MNKEQLSPLFDPVYATPEDFVIKINNDVYYTHKIVVYTLSKRIFQEAIQYKNNNQEYSCCIINKYKDPNHYFNLINDFFHGKPIKYTAENSPFICAIAFELEIELLYKESQKMIPQLTNDNALALMKCFSESEIENNECAKFIAHNWKTFSENPQTLDLPIFAFHLIFSDEDINVDDEEEFFNYIKKLVEHNGREYSALFSYCYPDKMKPTEINEIISLVQYDSVSREVVESLLNVIDPIDDHMDQPQQYNQYGQQYNQQQYNQYMQYNQQQYAQQNMAQYQQQNMQYSQPNMQYMQQNMAQYPQQNMQYSQQNMQQYNQQNMPQYQQQNMAQYGQQNMQYQQQNMK